jgi:Uma2 family endonuclease
VHGAVCFGAGTGFVVGAGAQQRIVAVDAAVVRKEHITEGAITGDVYPGAPDLAVIVVSPHDRFDDVEADVHAMLDNGTRHVWIVRPRVRMVTVHDAPRQVTVVGASETLSAADVLPAFYLPVANLFESA